jgi:hypothetical protein
MALESIELKCPHKDCPLYVTYERHVSHGAQSVDESADDSDYVYLTCKNGHRERYDVPWPAD